METVINGVTYVSAPDPTDGPSACDRCAFSDDVEGCRQGYGAGCMVNDIFWLRKDLVRQEVETKKAFGAQIPLFPEIEPPVTEEEEQAFAGLSKAQEDYIKAIGSDPLSVQVGGGHYKSMPIQPVEYITKNKLGYCEANVVKYISRWRDKGGKKDLEKAKHYIDLLIQLENL